MSNESQNQKSPAALREEAVLKFWEEQNIFQKSLEKNKDGEPFVFFEGPPTANAKPALHHLEARAFKDVIPRYKTMQGFSVPRRAGWDTHGLPVELQIEKKLGLASKKDIEKYGMAAFNKECKESVFTYIHDWEVFTDRIGYWVDKKTAYYTFNPSYMESLWSIISKVNDRGLLYKDYKVLPWCPRCGTTLASHELAQEYHDDKDLTVYAKFPIKGFEKAYFVAWTTTPWTLPGNVALAVGADIEYVEIKVGEEILVIAKERLSLITDPYEIVAEHKGSEMVGMEYGQIYTVAALQSDTAHKIYAADFVTTTDGTGIVHIAPMYGADDFVLGTSAGLPKVHTVNEEGKFIAGIDFLEGRFVKDEEVAIDIIKDLAHRGLLFRKEKYEHSYPHCWRCKTPLIYYARDSWYIRMSELRGDLMKANDTINWEPDHIKEGRFGEWIREVKDWAISRERYWGTPLPIWVAADGEKIVVDSVDTLKKYSKKSGNNYFVMRHGQSECNVTDTINCVDRNICPLTSKGSAEVEEAARKLSSEKIDVIITSPFLRTIQTAEAVASSIGYTGEIVTDERLIEIQATSFDGKTWKDRSVNYTSQKDYFVKEIEGDENLLTLKRRMGAFLYDIETKYQGKNILIIGHGAPLNILPHVVHGRTLDEMLATTYDPLGNGEVRQIDFTPLPHNDNFELDLHRPYIDDVILEKDGKEFRRVKEVMDVWFDSGSMPFAQDHYPFEHKGDLAYPADFISEAIDQTRGWFYTLLAVGVLMERGAPYKNVISLGHLLDKDGKKMSKSIGNIVEPFEQMDKFGVDAVRFWMYSVNQPGESKNYDEKSVAEINNKVFNLLGNVYSFYELYRDKNLEGLYTESTNVLDQWIMARLNQTIEAVTTGLDGYDLFTPTRSLREFLDDLSTWYLRRSRDRLKDGDIDAKCTLYHVLKTTVQLLAPFAPFMTEDLWQKLKTESDEESVHLSVWPKKSEEMDNSVVEYMAWTREFITLGLEQRQKNNLKVRQPLSKITFASDGFDGKDVIIVNSTFSKYIEIMKDELNVKEIASDPSLASKMVNLDIEITPELKLEGDYRELVRAVQDMRKEKGLAPQDVITLTLPAIYQAIIDTFGDELKKTVGAQEVVVGGETIVI